MGFYDNTVPGIDKLWSWAQHTPWLTIFCFRDGRCATNQIYMVAASNNNFPLGPAGVSSVQHAELVSSRYLPNVGDHSAEERQLAWFAEQYGICAIHRLQNPFIFHLNPEYGSHTDLSSFDAQLQSGNVAAVSFIQPASITHAPGIRQREPGALWLDGFIQSIQNSSIGRIRDCGPVGFERGWYDHVPPPTVDSQALDSRPHDGYLAVGQARLHSKVQHGRHLDSEVHPWNWQLRA